MIDRLNCFRIEILLVDNPGSAARFPGVVNFPKAECDMFFRLHPDTRKPQGKPLTLSMNFSARACQ
jgi:hypothetical protein